MRWSPKTNFFSHNFSTKIVIQIKRRVILKCSNFPIDQNCRYLRQVLKFFSTQIFEPSAYHALGFWISFQYFLVFRRPVVVYKGGFVGRSVGRSVCLQNILKNSKSRFGDYIDVVSTLTNTLLIVVLYRYGRLVCW